MITGEQLVEVKTKAGEPILWPECTIDAEPGNTTCNTHCGGCMNEDFRRECLGDRLGAHKE